MKKSPEIETMIRAALKSNHLLSAALSVHDMDIFVKFSHIFSRASFEIVPIFSICFRAECTLIQTASASAA